MPKTPQIPALPGMTPLGIKPSYEDFNFKARMELATLVGQLTGVMQLACIELSRDDPAAAKRRLEKTIGELKAREFPR